MVVKSYIPYPSNLQKSQSSLRDWESLQAHAPCILSDVFGSIRDEAAPPIDSIFFADIYPLSIMLLDRMSNSSSLLSKSVPVRQCTVDPQLFEAFLASSAARVQYFQSFLQRWGFHAFLGSRSSWPFPPMKGVESPRHEDVRVLGLHLLNSRQALQRYLLHWRDNTVLNDHVQYLH